MRDYFIFNLFIFIIIIIIIIINIERLIGLEISVSDTNHEIAGSIPSISTILNVD